MLKPILLPRRPSSQLLRIVSLCHTAFRTTTHRYSTSPVAHSAWSRNPVALPTVGSWSSPPAPEPRIVKGKPPIKPPPKDASDAVTNVISSGNPRPARQHLRTVAPLDAGPSETGVDGDGNNLDSRTILSQEPLLPTLAPNVTLADVARVLGRKAQIPFADVAECIVKHPTTSSQFFEQQRMVHIINLVLSENIDPKRRVAAVDLLRMFRYKRSPMNSICTTACYRAYAIHDYRTLFAITRFARQQRILSADLLDWHAFASLLCQDYRYLETTLDDFAALSLKPRERTYRFLLTGAFQNHDLEMAQQIVKEIQRRDCMTPALHAHVAQLSRSVGSDEVVEEQALAILELLPKPEQTRTLNSLIQSHLDRDRTGPALRLLHLFEPGSVEIITEVLSGKGGGPTNDEPTPLRPPPDPPTPDGRTYYLFMHHFGVKHHELNNALRLLHFAVTAGMTPDENIIIGLVESCFTCNRPDLALQLVAGVCNPATTRTQLFEEILPGSMARPRFEVHIPSMTPSVALFNALLKGVLRLQGFEGASIVLQIMSRNKVGPNDQMLTTLLQYMLYYKNARPRTLISVLDTLLPPGQPPPLRALRFILRAMQRQLEFLIHGEGWNHLKFTETRTPQPVPDNRQMSSAWDERYNSAAGLQAPPFRQYKRLLDRYIKLLDERGVEPDASMFLTRIIHEAVIMGDLDAATQVFQHMLERGLHPDQRHYGVLMHGYALRGDQWSARQVMEQAKGAEVKPNAIMYTTLISAAARRGKPRTSLEFFDEMVSRGITPDIGSVDAVAGAYYAIGMVGLAKEFLLENWAITGESPPDREDVADVHVIDLAKRFRSLSKNPMVGPVPIEEGLSQHQNLSKIVRMWKSVQRRVGRNGGGDRRTLDDQTEV